MEKRYQVFVSSTYADLKEERQKVIQALMELDCIPAGMELFPAADEEQFEFIKRVIDDCDYYLLIVGGRYGSLTAQGISYTEQEYEYALNRGLKVVALIHEKPDEIPFGKSEQHPELRNLLQAFRDRVATDRLERVMNFSSRHSHNVNLCNVSKALSQRRQRRRVELRCPLPEPDGCTCTPASAQFARGLQRPALDRACGSALAHDAQRFSAMGGGVPADKALAQVRLL